MLPQSVIVSPNQPILYHISFRDDLAGLWKPKPPAGLDKAILGGITEPTTARISCAPTLKGCFTGVYPNVSKYFKEMKYPYMTFYVYSPVFKGTEKIWTPEAMTKAKAVWDAFYTKEVSILDPVEMRLIGEIKVHNTNGRPIKSIHPYNDAKLEVREAGPIGITIEWINKV